MKGIVLLLFFVGGSCRVLELLQDFSQAVDVFSEDDMTNVDKIKEQFIELLRERRDILNESLICDVIWSSSVFNSNAVKIFLSSGRGDTIKTSEMLWPWSGTLLKVLLFDFTHLVSSTIAKPVCKDTLTPLEFSVKLYNVDAIKLLLELNLDQAMCQSHDCELVLHYAAVKQDVYLIKLLIDSLLRDNDIDILCKSYSTAYYLCALGLACESHNVFSSIVIEAGHNCILNHPPDIVSKLLSWVGLQEKEFHSLYTVTPSNGGWFTSNDFVDETCDIPIILLEDLTTHDFKILEHLSVPVLIKGGLRDSPLFEEWSLPSLRNKYGLLEVTGGTIPYGEVFGEFSGASTIAEFLDYMTDYNKANKKQIPLYIFDVHIIPMHFSSLITVPDKLLIWNATLIYQFILGPKGSGAPFHFHCSAINSLVYGRKQWFLYPPGKGYYSKTHPLNWNYNEKYLQCLQFAGDILYVPSGWSHSTLNADDCIGHAIEFDTCDC